MAEKPKTPESPSAEPEAVKTAKKVREGIDTLAALGEFEKSVAGQEILQIYDLKNIFEVFEDEEIFNAIVAELPELQERIDPIHFRAFLMIAVEKYPHVILEAVTEYSQFQDDPETLKIVLRLLREQGYEVAAEMFKEPEGEYEPAPFPELELELPEDVISPVRRLLISTDQIDSLPPEVADIISGHASFRDAMEDEEAFEKFLEKLDILKEKLTPELYSEMLVVAAEMSDEVDKFLKVYEADSFRQAMGSHKLFLMMMKGWLFKWLNECIEQPQLMQELLIVAAKASKENAQWFLDKAKRDEEGGPMHEEPAYILREAIGDEAFEKVIETAKQTLEISE